MFKQQNKTHKINGLHNKTVNYSMKVSERCVLMFEALFQEDALGDAGKSFQSYLVFSANDDD
jgi:hypothetical protein